MLPYCSIGSSSPSPSHVPGIPGRTQVGPHAVDPKPWLDARVGVDVAAECLTVVRYTDLVEAQLLSALDAPIETSSSPSPFNLRLRAAEEITRSRPSTRNP